VIRLKTALDEQLFDIAERERVAKIPAHGTNNQLRRRLPPLEDRWPGCVLHGLFRLPAIPAKVATHPFDRQGFCHHCAKTARLGELRQSHHLVGDQCEQQSHASEF
jgi:hypothetical protein